MFPTPVDVKIQYSQMLLHMVMKDVNAIFHFWDGQGTRNFPVGSSYNPEALKECKRLLKKQGWDVVEKKTKSNRQWFISAKKPAK